MPAASTLLALLAVAPPVEATTDRAPAAAAHAPTTDRRDPTELRLEQARTLLAHGQQAQAEQIIHGLVRLSKAGVDVGDPDDHGAPLALLYRQIEAKLAAEGVGTVVVGCQDDCVVLIDGHEVPWRERDLYLGTYDLQIHPTSSSERPRQSRTMELREAGARVEYVVWRSASAPPPVVPVPRPASTVEPERGSRAASRGRMLPRWAELVGLGVGVGLAATGIGVWSVDGKCQQVGQAITDCPKIWESTTAGAVLLSLGASLTVASAVLLTLDERRRPSSRDEPVPRGRRARILSFRGLRF